MTPDPLQQKAMKRHAMVRWYKPTLLIRVALRSLIVAVVGQVVDNREIQAALNPVNNDKKKGSYDYSNIEKDDDFWLDYVADIGDGWDSTYAVASQLAKPSLGVDGNTVHLRRGHLLIMGGDEVYPDPSVDAYKEHTIAPYSMASKHAYMDHEPNPPHLFALPGNHDWLDGLNAFNNIFCQSRGHANEQSTCTIGSWVTCQKRSYFSLKLPHGWWLCGVDIQVDAGTNTTQIDYFRQIADTQMQPGDRIILCCETPEWLLENISETNQMESFANILNVLTPSGAELRLVLAGDIHHYSRYKADNGKVAFITAGGGGAFLHPTHKLPDTRGAESNENKQTKLRLHACYPEKKISLKRSHKLLLFPFLNWEFAMLIGIVYSLMAWIFEANTLSIGQPMSSVFMSWLSGNTATLEGLAVFFNTIPRLPGFALILLVLYIGFIKFNFSKRLIVSIGLGFAHAIAHFMPFILGYFVAAWTASQIVTQHVVILDGLYSFLTFISTMFVISSLLGGFVFGLYLWVALNCFGLQWTNAFSALRISDYRNFLRMKINSKGELTIYPIKIDRVAHPDNTTDLIERPFTIK